MKTLKILIYFIILSVSSFYVAGCGQNSNENGHDHSQEKVDDHENHDHNSESHDEHDHVRDEEESHDNHDHNDFEEDGHANEIEFSANVAAEVGIVVKPISPKSLLETKTFPGLITPRPNGEAHVGSLVGGRVVVIPVGLGEKVAKGSPLCKIESPEVGVAQANYIRAHARDALAQKDLARQKQLKAQDIGAEKSFSEKQAIAKTAKAELSASKRTLLSIGFTEKEISQLIEDHSTSGILTLKSPINGTITDLNLNLGQRVTTEQDLFHIVDLTRLWVQISLYEKDLPYVTCKQIASIKLQSNDDKIFEGKVVQIGKEVNQETRTIKSYIEVSNEKDMLIPNLFVSAELSLSIGNTQVLAVPEEAVVMDEHGDQSVFIEHEPFRYMPKEITTGRISNGWIEVTSGLEQGERVVFRGTFFIKSEAAKGAFGHGHAH